MATPSASLERGDRRAALLAAAACLLPLLLQLPAPQPLAIAAAAAIAAIMASRGSAPGWLRTILALGVAGFVLAQGGLQFGRDTGCALLAAMLAIKPSELRSLRDGRSLLGFALFAPFATFLLDQGPLSLALGLLGTLLALVALMRISERESGLDSVASAGWQRPLMIGKLVAIGLPLTLAAFWLFPRLATPLWGIPELAAARPGLSDTMSPGDWLDMIADDTPAMRVTFHGAEPETRQMYWRGPTLSDYDGRTWRESRRLRAMSPATVERGRPLWDYEIEIEPTDRHLLVALEMPIALPDGVHANQSWSLRSERRLDQVTRWRMQSAPPARFEPELPERLRRLALRLPEGFNPRTRELARQWRSETDDDAELVERALAWIRRDFAYTMDTPLPGRHAVDEFLFEYRAGFCEHFSSAFAVLMREAGIPARVVTGFVGGTRNRYGNYWVVRRMDAHAWTEVWLKGRGWVRVDPTAAVAPERIYDTLEDRIGGAGNDRATLPITDLGDWARRAWNDFVLGFDAARQQRMLQRIGLDGIETGGLAALFSACAALALVWMLWLVARSEREHDPLLRAWHRLGRRYAAIGLARAPHEPALEWAGRVLEQRPGEQALFALTRRFVNARYAPGSSDPRLVRDLVAHRPGSRTAR